MNGPEPRTSGEGRTAGRRRSALRRLGVGLAVVLTVATGSSEAQVRRVEILGADLVEVTTDSLFGTVRQLTGDVRLRQDTTVLRARAATYYESRGEVQLTGDVRIISGEDTLTAEAVTYDSNTKVSVATGGVRLGDGESVLLAPVTTYDSRAEVSAFEGGGRILHRGAALTAPSGTYSSARRFARLDGPVRLEDSTGVLTAERGTYDARVRRADFAGAVRLVRPDSRLWADSLVYFRRTERARAYGKVVLERIGEGETVAERPAAPADSSRRTFLFGTELLYDGQEETASARGTPDRDPLLLVLRADSTGRVDTTLARAPRLDAARLVVGTDTAQVVTAAGGARLWERRLAAVADSARFVRFPRPEAADGDSLAGPEAATDRLGLFGSARPSVWADGSQLTGDSLFAAARDGAVDSLRVLGTAFAARLDSTLGRLQQIAGGQMLGLFDGDALRSLSVWPTAQAFYPRATAEGLLGGADQVSADSLSFQFVSGELRGIAGYRGVQGTTYGPSLVPADLRLPGFAFVADGAPTRSALLDAEGWEAQWLRENGPPPDGLLPPDALPTPGPEALAVPEAEPPEGRRP